MKDIITEVVKRIQYLLPGVEVTLQHIPKNNDVIRTGVVLKSKDNDVAPVFYIEDMIDAGWSADRIAMGIYEAYQNDPDTTSIYELASKISDYDFISDYLTLHLINRNLNQNILVDIPHMPFLEDLAVMIMIDLEPECRLSTTIKVTQQILKLWNVSFEEVYCKAYVNLIKEEANLKDLTEMLAEHGRINLESINDITRMCILTNSSNIYGASMMLREPLLKEFTQKFDSDLIIIPSSVHELLLVPVYDLSDADISFANEMVRTVNQEHLNPMEILSDHVYLYRKDTGWYNQN